MLMWVASRTSISKRLTSIDPVEATRKIFSRTFPVHWFLEKETKEWEEVQESVKNFI